MCSQNQNYNALIFHMDLRHGGWIIGLMYLLMMCLLICYRMFDHYLKITNCEKYTRLVFPPQIFDLILTSNKQDHLKIRNMIGI